MNLSLKSKLKSDEILEKRKQMIESEHLHIKGTVSKEEFKSLYQKYGSNLDEKDFAWAFLDMDEVKYINLEKEKSSESTILSYEYVSDEEFNAIRNQVIETYNLKDKEKIPVEKILEMYDRFGGKLHIDMFFEEILGIKSETLKRFRKANTTVKNGKINFEVKPGKYNEFNNKPLKKDEIPMYVLNPEYILDVREKLIYEAGLHIGESIDYERFNELYKEYGKDMTEIFFAEEILDIGVRSLNRMKSPQKFSTIIFDNVEIPDKYILELRDKITILNKLEGGQLLEYSKLRDFHQRYGQEFLEKDFAVKVLDVTSENYRPTGTNSSVTILNTKETNFEAIRNRLIRQKHLHYDDMIDYSNFQEWHQEFAPNMPEVIFAEKILDIRAANFMEVKHYAGRARILLNSKLPSKEEMDKIRKQIVLEKNFHINDEIDFEELQRLHKMHGGIMSMEIFAIDVLLMSPTGFKDLRRDYEYNKDNENYKPRKAYVLFNYEIPLKDIEELKNTIKGKENLENPRMMGKEEIEDLYNEYGGIMSFNMFLRGILGVSTANFENLKYGLHKETLVHIREKLNSDEIKALTRLLVQGLSITEIARKMEVPTAFLKESLKTLEGSKELSEANLLYEKVKFLSEEQNVQISQIALEVGVSEDDVRRMLDRRKKEKKEEKAKAEQERRQKKAENKAQKKRDEIEKKARKAIDEYEYKDKYINNVRAYIEECKEEFEAGEFSKKDLDFLMECMLFVQCNNKEIEFAARICVSFYEYKLAAAFISDTIDNEGITQEEKDKLLVLRKNIQYAVKKENALQQLKLGTKAPAEIAKDTGILEVDVLKLKKVLQENNVSMLGKRPNPTEDGQVI